MTLKHLFLANCVIATVFSITLIFFPATTGEFYGQHLDADGAANTRMWGSAIFGFALITWLCRNAEDSCIRRKIVLALFIYFAVGFAASLFNLWNQPQPLLSWTTPLLYLLLALGYGYFHFVHHLRLKNTVTLAGLPN
jgi:hypothetical protein